MAPSSSSSTIPMLSIPEKKTIPTELRRLADPDLAVAVATRRDVESPAAADAPERRRDLLLSYLKALSLIEPRLAVALERCGIASLAFTWHDAFRPSRRETQSIGLEKAAAIFNLAAAESRIGASAAEEEAAEAEGPRRRACAAFQRAAGALAFLRESAVLGGASVDVSAECVGMLEKIMLAQAQECFFEKVIADAKPPVLCSKIAQQVSLYYEEAVAALGAPPLDSHLDKTWHSYAQTKARLYHAEACYRCSLELHEQGEIAEEIARLKSGLAGLAAAKKLAKGAAASVVSQLELDMNRSLERANRENAMVYFMRVPRESSLPPLPAVSLVRPRPTPMDTILEITEHSSKPQ